MLGFGRQAMDLSVSKKDMCYSLNVTLKAQETTVIVFSFVLTITQGD